MSDVCVPAWAFWFSVPFWIAGVVMASFVAYVVIGMVRIFWKGLR